MIADEKACPQGSPSLSTHRPPYRHGRTAGVPPWATSTHSKTLGSLDSVYSGQAYTSVVAYVKTYHARYISREGARDRPVALGLKVSFGRLQE